MTEALFSAMLNTVHVPEDAGEYEDGLRRILARIPDGWGRWIGCGPGWYPLLVETDERLAAIDPDYQVLQVKEKFAELRYYHEITNGRYDEGWAVELDVCERSVTICETCGDAGEVRDDAGWLRTLCDGCLQPTGGI